jgi:predicted ester cyclase
MVLAAFPDLHISIDQLIAEGETVVGRFTLRGTQQGEFNGIPPTHKQIAFTATETFRVQADRIAEQWVSMDTLGMLQQLGVIPPPG